MDDDLANAWKAQKQQLKMMDDVREEKVRNYDAVAGRLGWADIFDEVKWWDAQNDKVDELNKRITEIQRRNPR